MLEALAGLRRNASLDPTVKSEGEAQTSSIKHSGDAALSVPYPARWFRPFAGGLRGFTPASCRKGQSLLVFLLLGRHER
jgi:hypothetical protein